MDKYLHCRLTVSAKTGMQSSKQDALARIEAVLDHAQKELESYGFEVDRVFRTDDSPRWPSDAEKMAEEARARIRAQEILRRLRDRN